MDLRFTEQEEAFRAELRAWLAEVLPTVPPEPDRFDTPARRVWDTAWQRHAVRRRVRRDQLAQGVRGPRGHPVGTPHLPGGDGAGSGTVRRAQLRRAAACRTDPHRGGHARAEGVPPSRHPHRRPCLVPGVLGAECGQRSRQPADPRRSRRRRLRDLGAEDLDQFRAYGRLLRAARAHRSRRAQTSRASRG